MKENQRVALTKRLLREGLLRLLKTKPLERINVSELCQEAGINRATFYRHYELPRDVLLDIEKELIQEVRIRPEVLSGQKEMERYFENILSYLYAHAEILKLLLENRSDEELVRVIRDELYQIIFEISGEIRGISDLDEDSMKLLFAYTAGGIYFLLRQWLMEGMNKTPEEIAKLIFRFFYKEIIF